MFDLSDLVGERKWDAVRIGLAEFMGTAILVFLGCMAGVVGMGPTPPTHLQICLTFGLVVGSVIQIIGHITSAHLNPAVTATAVILGKITLPMSAVYVVAQLAGAIIGYGMLVAVTPRLMLEAAAPNGSCCALCVTMPHPDMTGLQAVLAEAMVTSVLILVVCSVWDARNSRNTDSTPLKFSFVVAAIATAEGPYTGASMNPARSLGPAVWTGVWTSHWVYWVGPLLGAVVITYTYKLVWGVSAPLQQREAAEESAPLREANLSTSATNLNTSASVSPPATEVHPELRTDIEAERQTSVHRHLW